MHRKLIKIFYTMRHSQSKKFSSLIGPATIPSGGFKVSSKKVIHHQITAKGYLNTHYLNL
jgi:hypothetical protein